MQILNQVMPEVAFQEQPFDSVIAWLSDFTRMNINVRWQILQDAGVRRDQPITIQARNLRLNQVLWLIVSEAGGSDLKLAYRATGNLLVLSTADDLNKEMVTKVYDIADLLVNVPRASRQAVFNVSQGMGQGGGGTGGGGGGGGMFQQGNQNNTQDDRQGNATQLQELLTLIQDTVEPDTWRQNGGSGSIIAFQNTLIVRNTILVHQRLGGYVTEEEALGR
jgi:hypothetical protein